MADSKKTEILRLRSLFPSSIKVRVIRSEEDGGFCAEITSFPGVITEADKFSELIEMVNDAMLAYFEVPDELAPFMKTYLPPVKVAQELGIFPVQQISKEVELTQ